MASTTIPIRKLRIDSTLSTSFSRSLIFPSWFRKPLKLWLFPRVLREVNSALSGEAFGKLTGEQAWELYGPLRQLHVEICDVLKACSTGWFSHLILHWWIRSLTEEAEKLGDIVESLAWGADPELRKSIDSSVSKIELQLR